MTSDIEFRYETLAREAGFSPDAAQCYAVARLAKLASQLSFWGYWKRRISKTPLHGIYLWGDAGRGKSTLLRLFFDTVSLKAKSYKHFYAFMREAHEDVFAWRQHVEKTSSGPASHGSASRGKSHAEDVVTRVARKMARRTHLLCLDEFWIRDIVDASIITRLFEALWRAGVTVVITSNSAPNNLYAQGLHRQRFLPFIAAVQNTMEVISFDGEQDYRLGHRAAKDCLLLLPLSQGKAQLDARFDTFARKIASRAISLEIKGRKVTFSKTAGDVVRCTFHELCLDAIGFEDYEALARKFSLLIFGPVPPLTPQLHNAGLRFMALVDVLYEHKVKLVMATTVALENLCEDDTLKPLFSRTFSRLEEMRSATYQNHSKTVQG